MVAKQIAVLVGAIGGGGHGEQIVKALRASEPGRYIIVGGDVSRYCPQFAMVDEPVLLPKASDPNYIDAVLALAKRYAIKAVFHGCEPELLALHRGRDRLTEAGIFLPINPPGVLEICMDKARTAEFLSAHGFDAPWFVRFAGRATIEAIPQFPVIVKPARGGGGSRDTFIAQTSRQLEILTEYLDAMNEPFLIQEYIGPYTEEYTVGVLHDMDGRLLHSIALRRLMNSALNIRLSVRNTTGRKELGEWLVVSSGVSHGEFRDFPEVRKQCEEVAAALGAKGPINIQCRFAHGKIRIFEINPRFSGTTSLRAMMGYNEPDLLIRQHLLGEQIQPRFPYRFGTVLRSLVEHELTAKTPPTWKELL